MIEDLDPCPRMEVLWSLKIYTLGQPLNLTRKFHTVEGKD